MSEPETNAKTSASQDWGTYRRLIRYIQPYTTRLILGAVFGILCGGSTVGLLLSLKKTLAAVFDPQSLSWAVIVASSLLLPLFGLLLGLGNYLSTYYVAWVGNRVVMDLRTELFAHIHRLPMIYFSQSRTGELISRTTNDTLQVERAVSTVMIDLVREPFVLVATVGYLFWLDAKLATLSLVLFPICILPVALFGRRVRRFAREGQQKLGDLTSTLQETITGAKIVKAYGMEEKESSRFAGQAGAVFSRVMKVTRASAAIDPIVVTISFAGLALALLYARWAGMTQDQFFTFGAALVMMYQPVKKISKLHMAIQQGSGAADRIFELKDAPRVEDGEGAVEFGEPIRRIEFDRVSFSYGEEPVLADVSFQVEAGQCVAFVGSSGSGKTTLVNLLPRFFDVQSGRVLINGRDARSLTLKSLRRQIGIVTQETILFNDTVANNIAYGHPEASRDAIVEAARRAHAHDFIEQLPQGYETVIGERGLRLSGGQCQRLAIARALLRNPPILILDEATSALDTESERQVQAALDELMAGRTVFAIAHRLSTIMHANLILVLDKGAIVERGTHQELLARGGLYKYLYDLQFRDVA
mgnify:CR=1 FL=1